MAMAHQALDDLLLGNKTDMHIVLESSASDKRTAWICSKSFLQDWLGKFTAAGVRVHSAYSEYALIPVSGPQAHYTQEGNLIFRAKDGAYGYVDTPAQLVAISNEIVLTTHDQHLAKLPIQSCAVNFLAGLGTANALESVTPARLRRSAWLAGAVCATLMLATVLQWQRLAQREQQLRDGIRQTFAAAFPGIPIVDPYLQWQSLTQAGKPQAQADALDQLVQLASQLPAVRPRSADVRDGQARLLLTESDLVTARAQLQQQGQPFTVAPAEAGFVRLDIPLARR